METTEIRKALNVPEGIRIAQHIYNVFRDYEQKLAIQVICDGKILEKNAIGVDIFYVEDDEFVKRFK